MADLPPSNSLIILVLAELNCVAYSGYILYWN